MLDSPLCLLLTDHPAPVTVLRPEATSPLFLTCEHAGRTVPRGLRDLGGSDRERARHIGLLFNRDPKLASVPAPVIEEDRSIRPSLNEPCAISDATDFTIPVQDETRGMVPVEFEGRQDSFGTAEGQSAWAEHLAKWLFRCPENPSIMAWA